MFMRLRSISVLPVAAALLLVAGPVTSAAAYPATTCPTLAVSTTTPLEGQAIGLTGTQFNPHARIQLELSPKPYLLRTVTSNSRGSFSTTVTMPKGLVGNRTISAIGGGSNPAIGCPTDPVETIGIQTNGGGGGGTTHGGSTNGGPAFTGIDVLGLIAAAIALLGGGVLLNRSGQRRRAHASRH
jgi:hypothetical protein